MNTKNIAILCYEEGSWLGKVASTGDSDTVPEDLVHRAFLEHMKAARDSFVLPLTRERLQDVLGEKWRVEREHDRWVFRLRVRTVAFVLTDTSEDGKKRTRVRGVPRWTEDVLAMADAIRAVEALL